MQVIFPDGTRLDATGFTSEVGPSRPTWGLYLYERWQPPWPYRYVSWPDFGLPDNERDADDAILEAWGRAQRQEAVQVGCRGGVGRTGTVLSCMAVLAGVEPTEAVSWVRRNYQTVAVDNEAQETWVLGFAHRHGQP
ncbi:MAG TPA: protein-tyrosine phosphatase family protein [Acidimicrobiales bacterium]|nr:protein-tyrosine phosphatase family protein [Acidimicrobiales bacterium]